MTNLNEIGATQLTERIYADLQNLVTAHGPEAMDLALRAIQIEAIFSLAISMITIAVIAVAARQFIRYVRSRNIKLMSMDGPAWTDFACICGGFCGLAMAMLCIFTLLSPTLWVTAFDPRLGLALKVINAAGGNQ